MKTATTITELVNDALGSLPSVTVPAVTEYVLGHLSEDDKVVAFDIILHDYVRARIGAARPPENYLYK